MLDRFTQYLTCERMYSALTVRAYIDDCKALILFLDEVPLWQCTIKDARAFVMTEVESGRNPRSINRRISSLRTFFNFLIRCGVIKSNPFQNIKSLKAEERLPNFVKKNEMKEMARELSAIVQNGEYAECRDAFVVLLLYATGMRRAEIVAQKLDNIDRLVSSIKVDGKGGKERIVPLGRDVRKLMKIYLEKREVFCCENDEKSLFLKEKKTVTKGKDKDHRVIVPLKVGDIYTIVKEVLEKNTTGARPSPHTLRHTFATHLMAREVGVRSIQELLGHSSIASTNIYTHATIETLKESYQKAHPRAKKDLITL